MARFFMLLNLTFLMATSLLGQEVEQPVQEPLKIAIVAPMFIDSAFNYGIIKKNLPKYMTAGLEFVQGAELALDTINTNGREVKAYIVDSRAKTRNLGWMIKNGGLNQMDLIIGGVKEPEFTELAKFAQEHRIPFVSAIYPNDGGVREDSFLIIMNSTLRTHVNGIYNYILQQHGMDQILLLKQRGDNRIDQYFQEANRTTGKSLLKIKSIAMDSINSTQLAMLIDTLKPAVVIGASLNEQFALNIADACFPFKGKITLIGMPNWEGFRDLYNKDRYTDFPVLYTTPHLDEEKNAFTGFLGNEYFTKYRSRPGDMASKGFEATYYFTNILLNYGDSLLTHLNENQYACFHEFNFRPVALNVNGATDYFENSHVFIVQILNGMISKIW